MEKIANIDFKEMVDTITKGNIPCIFVSPHLDDAVLSAGELIAYLSSRTRVEVVTVFTKASEGPYTLSAKAFMRQCRHADAGELFENRKKEDVTALSQFNIKPVHLDFVDAIFRKKISIGRISKILSVVIPEISHVYPTHRIHIASGVVSRGDEELSKSIRERLESFISQFNSPIIFCPLGARASTHVDHIVTRNVCMQLGRPLVYWSDFPYNLKSEDDNVFIQSQGLEKRSWETGLSKEKHEAVARYVSQIEGLFKDVAKDNKEVYYYKLTSFDL